MSVTRDRREFFAGPALEVAPALLGAVVEHETTAGVVGVRLTEVEAYEGPDDPGSHAYRGRTRRNAVMFGPPGHAYVYFTYGMHWCVNLVCGPEGTASAVLLRAGEIVLGEPLARDRRAAARSARDLARGPARLAQALGIDKACDGVDVCGDSSPLRVRLADPVAETAVCSGPRVGLSAAADRPWRFWVDGEPTVSVYRRHRPEQRSGTLGTRTSEEPQDGAP